MITEIKIFFGDMFNIFILWPIRIALILMLVCGIIYVLACLIPEKKNEKNVPGITGNELTEEAYQYLVSEIIDVITPVLKKYCTYIRQPNSFEDYVEYGVTISIGEDIEFSTVSSNSNSHKIERYEKLAPLNYRFYKCMNLESFRKLGNKVISALEGNEELSEYLQYEIIGQGIPFRFEAQNSRFQQEHGDTFQRLTIENVLKQYN